MSKIADKYLAIEIDDKGSTLKSFFDKASGKELLWQGDEKSWTGQDVTIFPFVARQKDEKYCVDGKEYHMPLHGLCCDYEFDIVEKTDTKVVHRFLWDEKSYALYPYKFDLYVTHEIKDGKYIKSMLVKNVDDKDMYFMLGGHPAIAMDKAEGSVCDTSGNYIQFSREIRPNLYRLNETGHFILHKEGFASFDRLYCDKKMLEKYKTLIFTDEKFDSLEVVRTDGIRVAFELNEPPVLAFWSDETYGEYWCVEPWYGVPDMLEPVREIRYKEKINKLEAGKSFSYAFTMQVK